MGPKASNVPIGRMTDIISKKNNEVEIFSSYIPAGVAALFKAKKVIRTTKFQNKSLIAREEESQGKTNEKVLWRKNGDKIWDKFVNGEPNTQITLDNPHYTIDSTSLPYLFQLGILGNNATEQDVNVITKNNPYEGKVTMEVISEDPVKKFKVFFKTSRNNGTVYFNSDKKPVEMLFEDTKFSFTGTLIETTCK